MLVCNVSMRPPRRAIAAALAETAAAVDAPGTGNVVFATLVDDPASVNDFIDAYLGEIMLEAASASDAPDAYLPSTYTDTISEAATATDTQSAALGLATFNGTATNTTLSNGNLTATHSNTSTDSGARSASLQSTGKYYYEITVGATHGQLDNVAIIGAAGTHNNTTNGLGTVVFTTLSSGAVYTNGGSIGRSIGVSSPGDIIGVAIDLDNRKAWFRRNGGNWNGQSTATENPVTNTGGAAITTGTQAPIVTFGGSGTAVNDSYTANFGQSAFAAAAPTGFGNWPA